MMNHLVLTVETHTTEANAVRIVGFEVEAKSINWGEEPCFAENPDSLGPQVYAKGASMAFTY